MSIRGFLFVLLLSSACTPKADPASDDARRAAEDRARAAEDRAKVLESRVTQLEDRVKILEATPRSAVVTPTVDPLADAPAPAARPVPVVTRPAAPKPTAHPGPSDPFAMPLRNDVF